MQYIEIQDGKVRNHYCGPSIPADGKEYKEVDDLTGGAMVGTLVNQLDDTGRLYTPDELVKKKILKKGKNQAIIYEDGSYVVKADYTGRNYWDKETGRQVQLQIGEEPGDNLTAVANEDPQATWNGKKWIIPPEVSAERIRRERNRLMADTDFLVVPDYPIINKEDILQYRQALRDITAQATFPQSVEWPVMPEVQKQGATK